MNPQKTMIKRVRLLRLRDEFMECLKKHKHFLAVPIYGFFYLLAFQYVEHRRVRPYIISMEIDEYIPFCEYFIIPYLLWFAYIFATVFYFSFINKNKKEYWQLIFTMGVGMTIFIIISLLFPNGQDLRPSLSGAEDSLCIQLVRHLYRLDTPTNIFPSIHVFNSVACCLAVFHHPGFRKRKFLLGGTALLTILIVLATVFLKQHTILDVIAALGLNAICWQLFYRPRVLKENQPARVRI